MKSQTSRPSFRPAKRYSGVYQQQGRMISDADWNELVEVGKERLREALEDAIASGAPRDDGFVREVAPGTGPTKLGWGRVYAEGVGAEVRADPAAAGVTDEFDYTKQLDFPSPPPMGSGGGAIFVDIWERHVFSLQDEWLRDPALRGADTCTRTQTLAQVKRCESEQEFHEEIAKYPIGTAKLSLVLLTETSEADECEPCAAGTKIERAVGNYLFRLEVHRVEGSPTSPGEIVLKWSSENGSVQYLIDGTPDDFRGSWIYEFFTETSEKHLGVHAPGDKDAIVVFDLVDNLTGAPDDVFVRRWDGYCRLTRDAGGWTLAEGKDRGTQLDPTLGGDNHGFVSLDALNDPNAPRLDVKLENLHLVLELGDVSFVAGDYWNAVVRERAPDGSDGGADQRVRLVSETPLGIRHHYLPIGTLNGAGDLMVPPGRLRRGLRFPPLTDLMAGDVGYDADGECPNALVEVADDTVEKVLDKVVDRLCKLAAEHVGYLPSTCDNNLFDVDSIDTVKDALDRLCKLAAKDILYASNGCENDWFDTSVTTVKEALDRLCGITASDIPYERNVEDCPYLGEVANVQDAIDMLCSQPTEKAEICSAFLALFGRGVICGLIPSIVPDNQGRRVVVQGGEVRITIEVSEGKLIDGRGCFWHLSKGLTKVLSADLPGPSFTIAPENLLKVRDDILRVAPSGLLESRTPAGVEPSAIPTDFRRARLPAGVVDVTNVARILENENQNGRAVTFNSEEMAREWIMANTGIEDEIFLGRVMEEAIRANSETGDGIVQRCLYLTVSAAGAFDLALRSCPQRPLYPVVGNNPNDFPGQYDPALKDEQDCEQAEQRAWEHYRSFYENSCLEPNDGSVCLGTARGTRETAWICPAKREDLLFTPAIVNAIRKREGIAETLQDYWDSWNSAEYDRACGRLGEICLSPFSDG